MRTTKLGDLVCRCLGGADGDGGGDGPACVLLHGFGAPGDDLVPLAHEIDAPPGTRFVFPEAPLRLPPAYGVGRAWWMIDLERLQRAIVEGRPRELTREVPAGLAEAHALVAGMLDALGPGPLVLGGFSQGAMLACDLALRSGRPLDGLVLLSGTMLAEDEWRAAMAARAGLPVLQSHGRDDPLLPFAIAETLRDALRAGGLEVTWIPFAGGHGIAPAVLDELGSFLRRAYSSS
jgi:phospholipase/carboxylesterase